MSWFYPPEMMSPQIKRTWLFSDGAGRLYFWSAIAGISFLFILVGMDFRVGFAGGLNLFWFRVLLLVLFAVGAIGLATVWIAMWLCLLNFEKESFAGSIYLPLFILLGPLATLMYYFARYRKLLNTQAKAAAISA
jgi:hypothetical protein